MKKMIEKKVIEKNEREEDKKTKKEKRRVKIELISKECEILISIPSHAL